MFLGHQKSETYKKSLDLIDSSMEKLSSLVMAHDDLSQKLKELDNVIDIERRRCMDLIESDAAATL